jgi:hypothetical protein
MQLIVKTLTVKVKTKFNPEILFLKKDGGGVSINNA